FHSSGAPAISNIDQNPLREYLLGRISEPDEEQVELRLLVDADFNEELDIVASELIDEYVELELSPVEREQFEQHFLATENRKERLSFARALKKHKLELVSKKNLRR